MTERVRSETEPGAADKQLQPSVPVLAQGSECATRGTDFKIICREHQCAPAALSALLTPGKAACYSALPEEYLQDHSLIVFS